MPPALTCLSCPRLPCLRTDMETALNQLDPLQMLLPPATSQVSVCCASSCADKVVPAVFQPCQALAGSSRGMGVLEAPLRVRGRHCVWILGSRL
jgi:hypothetical protein